MANATVVLHRRVERVDRGAREAEDGVDALLLQDGDCGVDGTHAWHDVLPWLSFSAGQAQHAAQQGRVVEAAVAIGLGGGHQLRDDGAERDDDAGLARGGRHDAEVLVVQLDAEAGLERPGQHVLALLVEHLAAGESAAEDRERRFGVDAVRLEERDGLGEQLDVAGDDELVGGLDGLARSVRADVDDGLADRVQDGTGGVEVGLLAADHDRQGRLPPRPPGRRTPARPGSGAPSPSLARRGRR